MISIIARGFTEASTAIKAANKQIDFATAVAATRTAGIASKAISEEMPRALDRPTRFTLNSLFVVPARRNNLVAYVRIKDDGDRAAPAAKWLTPQIVGKSRGNKGSEKRLRSRGVLPANKYIVPGEGARLDRYGNITRRAMTTIIQGLGFSKKYFVLGPEEDPLGIGERTGRNSVRVVLACVTKPNYSRRLDFYGVGNKAIDKNFSEQFRKAYAQALATAR